MRNTSTIIKFSAKFFLLFTKSEISTLSFFSVNPLGFVPLIGAAIILQLSRLKNLSGEKEQTDSTSLLEIKAENGVRVFSLKFK